MKDYKQMAESVFEKIEKYEIKKKKRRKKIIGFSISASCFFVFLSVVFFINRNDFEEDRSELSIKALDIMEHEVKDMDKTGMTEAAASYPEEEFKEASEELAMEGRVETASDLKESLNEKMQGMDSMIEEKSVDEKEERMKETLVKETEVNPDDGIKLTKMEVLSYYKIKDFKLPEDLNAENRDYYIYKKDGGRGEVYFDHNEFFYHNETMSRNVRIEMEKGEISKERSAFKETEDKILRIGEKEIRIGKNKGSFFTEFIQNEVGLRIVTEGLTEEELTDLLSSLIS